MLRRVHKTHHPSDDFLVGKPHIAGELEVVGEGVAEYDRIVGVNRIAHTVLNKPANKCSTFKAFTYICIRMLKYETLQKIKCFKLIYIRSKFTRN
jgi:hypothetical protein